MGISDTSMAVKNVLPNYSQRQSSLLKILEDADVGCQRRRFEFEIGDNDTPPGRRVDVGDLSKREGRSFLETGNFALSDIESLARGLAG